jgi:iron complex transport system permease protein
MKNKLSPTLFFLLSGIACLLFWVLNLGLGSVQIPFTELIGRILGNEFSKSSWEIIFLEYRLPKSLTAILVGIALSASGLQMQTYFRNPLAGPFVLGISSGAGLGVAIWLMAGAAVGTLIPGMFGNAWMLFLAATSGAMAVLLLMSLAAWRVRDSMTLLIIGLMFGSLAAAIIAVLSYFSQAEQLKLFTVWSLGSLGSTGWNQLLVFLIALLIGISPAMYLAKSYNAMLLGENYAQSMGVNISRLRWIMIISTGILTGCATAFCGPIAFIGIAVPHIARMLLKTSDHRLLFPGSAILGAMVMLLCDTISQLPGSAQTLPINAITSLFGAPIVIWLILRRNFSKEF